MLDDNELNRLRQVITENLRVQRGGPEAVPYIDAAGALTDILARQNHVIFGRRGCGKTLLLQKSSSSLVRSTRTVYLNCEDFKNHSFPNVLIQILDTLFAELHANLSGWFGRKRRARELLESIRSSLAALRTQADTQEEDVKDLQESGKALSLTAGLQYVLGLEAQGQQHSKRVVERIYKRADDKIRHLNMLLPEMKQRLREVFDLSSGVRAVFLQVDDFYHLRRLDQPFVMDYIHRLCKDLPVYFKVATLRHASVLYVDRSGQPTGVQERHDFQPINVDFTLADFARTEDQNRQILHAFAEQAGIAAARVDTVFKGAGFERLVMAGGGVPRDFLSLFLEIVQRVRRDGDSRIGKDDVRLLSKANFERRIQELKQDSEGQDQDALIRGIHAIRTFCLDRKSSVFLIAEQVLQSDDAIQDLVHRLLDYRIIHSVGTAITHKARSGRTYHAFAIDIGCYAHLRTLAGRFTEYDITHRESREQVRSAPILELDTLHHMLRSAPSDAEDALLRDAV